MHNTCLLYTSKVGIITYEATPIMPPEYDNIEQINNQLYLVAINKKFGIINKEGKTIVYNFQMKIFEQNFIIICFA